MVYVLYSIRHCDNLITIYAAFHSKTDAEKMREKFQSETQYFTYYVSKTVHFEHPLSE